MSTYTVLHDGAGPCNREVDGAQVISWAKDAFANGEIPNAPADERDAYHALQEAGLVTFSRFVKDALNYSAGRCPICASRNCQAPNCGER